MSGGFEVNPDALEQAANQLDEAAGEADIAGDRIGQGEVPAAAFGRTGQAAELAERWNSAVHARVTEARFCANETRRLAEELRAVAANYRDTDDEGSDRIGQSDDGIDDRFGN